MSYKDLVNQSTQSGYKKAIAGRILMQMKELRQKANPHSERRWVWELLQNGKDVRYEDVPFKAIFSLVKDNGGARMEFSHNAQPFSVKDITYLVEQVSTKEQNRLNGEKPAATGKFGTGFLTTHLLSETVEIQAVVNDKGLDYKKCTLLLDRSPRDTAAMIQSIDNSLEVLTTLDELPSLDKYSSQEHNTLFRYRLDGKGEEVASKGLEDLKRGLPYSLIFVPEINEVHIRQEGLSYTFRSDLLRKRGSVQICTIEKKWKDGKTEYIRIAVVSAGSVQIAMPVRIEKKVIYLEPIEDNTPRLFCDFPLVGTEQFPFPVIINSPSFNPNDPRSLVLLNDVDDSEVEQNKNIIIKAVELYEELIDFCTMPAVKNTYLLAAIGNPADMDWIDNSWHKAHVLNPLYSKLSVSKLVDTENGLRTTILKKDGIYNVMFPTGKGEQIREAIFELAVQWFPYEIPCKKDLHHWAKVLWPDCKKLDLKMLTTLIENQTNIDALQSVLLEGINVIDWLNQYYQLLNVEGKFIDEIAADKYAVLPNQNGEFCKMNDLSFDRDIEEAIKDVLKLLGEDIREELRHNDIYTAPENKEKKEEQDDSTKKEEEEEDDDDNDDSGIRHYYIDAEDALDRLNKALKKGAEETTLNAAMQLATLFSEDGNTPSYRQDLLRLIRIFFPEQVGEEKKINEYNEQIWAEADIIIYRRISNMIAAETNLDEFSSQFGFKNPKQALDSIVQFIELLNNRQVEESLNISKFAIYPNQAGVFCTKEDLSSGNGTDEVLKDISALLGYNFRDELIDTAFNLEFSENNIIRDRDIAEKIYAMVHNAMATDEDDDSKKAFQLLFEWFVRNSQKAEEYFGDLYYNRHRLCDGDIVTKYMENSDSYQALLAEYGVANADELKQLIGNLSKQKQPSSTLLPLTQQILLSLGVQNEQELVDALQDKDLAVMFGHKSVASYEWFVFVQKMIGRTKRRIREHLGKLGYDFSEVEEMSESGSVLGGVYKDGRQINIVCRPSDNGEVIFYNGSEKDTLAEPDAELWIDNGKDTPEQLTLGRILKVNQIVKVKLD